MAISGVVVSAEKAVSAPAPEQRDVGRQYRRNKPPTLMMRPTREETPICFPTPTQPRP